MSTRILLTKTSLPSAWYRFKSDTVCSYAHMFHIPPFARKLTIQFFPALYSRFNIDTTTLYTIKLYDDIAQRAQKVNGRR